VLSFAFTGLSLSRLWLTLTLANLVTDLALTLSHTPTLAISELEVRQVDARQRDAYDFFALATDKFAIGHEASKLLFDFAPNDFAKSV
jgi:hypothetical protein